MKLTPIPYETWCAAQDNWDSLAGHQDREGFIAFMGYDFRSDKFVDDDHKSNKVIVPSHAVSKYQLLTGPHYKTLLKAYEAKFGPIRISHMAG